MMHINSLEDDLVHEVLQKAWVELLRLRDSGKIPNFDSAVPAQLESWLEDIWKDQLETYNIVDHERYKLKRFSIAIAFRERIKNIIGLDYFMEQMSDTKKMRAMDRLIESLKANLAEENDRNRDLR